MPDELPDISDIKSYLFDHVERPIETPQISDISIPKNEVYYGLTDDQAVQLMIALLAAEESAMIISESMRRNIPQSDSSDIEYVPQILQPSTIPTTNRVTRRKEEESQNIPKYGTRKFLDVSGIGVLHEVYIASPNNSFGISLYNDGELLYEGEYTDLQTHSVADSHLDVYDTDAGTYYIVIGDIKFASSLTIFVNNSSSTDTEFTILRANYEIEV